MSYSSGSTELGGMCARADAHDPLQLLFGDSQLREWTENKGYGFLISQRRRCTTNDAICNLIVSIFALKFGLICTETLGFSCMSEGT